MNNLQVFSHSEFGQIRTVMIDGEPWFVGKDVAEALGYEKARNAISVHVNEDDALKWGVTDSLGRTQDTTIINESGLYSLIFGSKLESAKRFKHWVTSEVLPAIRKTGSYGRYTPKLDEMHLKAMELIAECSPERLPYMAMILQDMGIVFASNMHMYRENSGTSATKKECRNERNSPVHNSMNECVADFIQNADVASRPTKDVYAEYCGYCSSHELIPLAHIAFSKAVNNLLGTRVIQKKINRVNRKVFVC